MNGTTILHIFCPRAPTNIFVRSGKGETIEKRASKRRWKRLFGGKLVTKLRFLTRGRYYLAGNSWLVYDFRLPPATAIGCTKWSNMLHLCQLIIKYTYNFCYALSATLSTYSCCKWEWSIFVPEIVSSMEDPPLRSPSLSSCSVPSFRIMFCARSDDGDDWLLHVPPVSPPLTRKQQPQFSTDGIGSRSTRNQLLIFDSVGCLDRMDSYLGRK